MATAADLIKRSYYMAQVLDPREAIEGFEAEEGLNELNKVIDTWSSLSIYIPTYTILTIAVLANVSTYNITPAITQLSESNILDANNVQYPLIQIDLQRFNTLNFALSATAPTRPSEIFLQQDTATWLTMTKVRLFPVPDTTYTATLYAMQRLANVTYEQDLSLVIPKYVQAALEYELADALITIYGTTPAANFAENYAKAMMQVKAANRRDRSVQVANEFQSFRRFRPWGTYVD